MAGLVPAIPILMAMQCAENRDARDKRGHDVERAVHVNWGLLDPRPATLRMICPASAGALSPIQTMN